VFGGACAQTSGGAPGAQNHLRTAPDDGDLWNLVPGDADAIADVNLAALRASPWSKSLMTGDMAGARTERLHEFGFDLFTEADEMVTAGTDREADPRSVTIARGRFDEGRLGAAFTASNPGATAAHWRDSPLWERTGTPAVATALVTPRTLTRGTPDAVRASVDAAWGVVPDARAGVLGELRRALDADHNRPAAYVALTVTDGMRGRASGFMDIPSGMRRFGARLDLGADLDVDAVALFDDAEQAKSAAAAWGQAAQLFAQQRMVALLGLAPVLSALTVGAEGARVHLHMRLPAEKREWLGDRLVAVLEALASARRQ